MSGKTEIFGKSIFELLKQRVILPGLYSPIEQLDNFLWENRHLFTLIGIFGAISVYLSTVEAQISESLEIFSNFAVVAGLSLVTILSLVILVKLYICLGDNSRWENIGLFIFAAFFVPLIIVITGLLTTFPQIWAIYYFMVIYVFGLAGGFAIFIVPFFIGTKIDEHLNTKPPVFSLIATFSLLITISALITEYPAVITQPAIEFGEATSVEAWGRLFLLISFGIAFAVSLFAAAFFTLVTILWCVIYILRATYERLSETDLPY
ncbi:hypothetical protein [Haloarcula sp. JP-L23]|uniref:hypothetical protein n=1 Tax=Haloarcula sp. JP-L23 TaxID=2716717 RepID=UPI00140EF56B|nr:hypothetical protein G9465_15690 [Haloarcula sp. JP-L23]